MITTMVAAPAAGMPEGKRTPATLVQQIENRYNAEKRSHELAMAFIIESGLLTQFTQFKQTSGHLYGSFWHSLTIEAKAQLQEGGLK